MPHGREARTNALRLTVLDRLEKAARGEGEARNMLGELRGLLPNRCLGTEARATQYRRREQRRVALCQLMQGARRGKAHRRKRCFGHGKGLDATVLRRDGAHVLLAQSYRGIAGVGERPSR